MSFTSYAQAGEDVLLWRALSSRVHHDEGFYIDVGGYDPDYDSVTRVFYDRGWHGINIEPVQEFFGKFVERRPRDINLDVALSDSAGEATFHEIVGHQLGTLVDQFAKKHHQDGLESRSYQVTARTLTDVCDEFVKDRAIHFLKIDVEGHEGAVLRGADFSRYRPWILVVEATEPNRLDLPTHAEWDDLIIQSGYIYAGTTLPNRYYVSEEKSELEKYFSLEPDSYELERNKRRREELESQVRVLQQKLNRVIDAAS